jgi:hypothetical protein
LAIPYIAPTNPLYMGRFTNGTACAAEQVDSGLGQDRRKWHSKTLTDN